MPTECERHRSMLGGGAAPVARRCLTTWTLKRYACPCSMKKSCELYIVSYYSARRYDVCHSHERQAVAILHCAGKYDQAISLSASGGATIPS